MEKVTMTVEQLERLLKDQIAITVERCLINSYTYNKESTDYSLKTLPIDESKFRENGLKAQFPNDFKILKKYSV